MTRLVDVTILALDDGLVSTAIGPMEVFFSAGRLMQALLGDPAQPRFNVRLASIDGKPIACPYGICVVPHCSLADVKQTDLALITASQSCLLESIPHRGSIVPWIRAIHDRGGYIASVCSGVVLVAESGLLDGRRATTHWGVADLYRERYPNVQWQPQHFITEDRGVFCGGGVYAAIDLSLYLVEKFCGHEIALECYKSLMVTPPRNLQSAYSVAPLSKHHDDEKVRQIELSLQNRFDKNPSIEAIAAEHAMSPRNLLRRFKAATGHLPGEYIQLLRVNAARQLLERGRSPVQKVAHAVGYEDATYFRGIFKRHTGMTPSEYRTRFGPLAIREDDARHLRRAAPRETRASA